MEKSEILASVDQVKAVTKDATKSDNEDKKVEIVTKKRSRTKKKDEQKIQISIEKAQEMIEKDSQTRAKKVETGLAKLLEDNKCRLEIKMEATVQGNRFNIGIIPL